MKFALYFANRGFFPGELVDAAREEMTEALKRAGHEFVAMDKSLTKSGAVETKADGERYAAFLKEHEDEVDGAILCLPNFGDENGAVPAFRHFKKPILIQAYPDEIGRMSFEERRDAFCGKLSIMDMFRQFGIRFTALEPHVCHPLSPEFARQIDVFARICAVVNGMREFSIGAIGARTTAFKTVRYDELALQKAGVTVDTFDLSEIFARTEALAGDERLPGLKKEYLSYSDFSAVPEEKLDLIARVTLAILDLVKEYRLDTLALRCWNEFPSVMKISVCVVVGFLNHLGIPCACELDVGNAYAMRALTLAGAGVSTCLDWNNNYGTQKNKCILFHCGPVARELMTDGGKVSDHKMFSKTWGKGCAFGACEGRIAPCDFTFLSAKTEDGKISAYLGEGKFTGEPIEEAFFGCGGVAEIPDLEKILRYIGRNGYRHHVSVTPGQLKEVLTEAFSAYLDCELKVF